MEIDWASLETAVSFKNCYGYCNELRQLANFAKEAGNDEAFVVYNLLADVTGYHQDFDKNNGPFFPAYVNGGQRSPIPSDLSAEQLSLLSSLAPNVSINMIRARLYDVLWIEARDHIAGRAAIEDYLTVAETTDIDSVLTHEVAERALQLSLTLDKKNLTSVVARIESIVENASKEKDVFLACKLIESLQEQKLGDFTVHLKALDEIISSAHPQTNYIHKNRLLSIKAQCHRLLNDQTAEKNAAISAANVFEEEADRHINQNNNSVGSHFLMQAIAAHRRIGGQQTETERLHAKLAETQAKAVSEAKAISSEVEFDPSHIEEARNYVSGKANWMDALIAMVRAHRLTPFKSIRENFEQSVEGTVMWQILPTQVTDKYGHTVATIPAVSGLQGEALEAAMFYHYARYASLLSQTNAIQLDVMREQILNEHKISENDLSLWLQSSIFVPPNRNRIFAKGLMAGLNGQWVTSIHLLIPQMENAIRYHLRINGNRVSYLNSEYVQDVAPLGTVLRDFKDEIVRIFGEDLFFWFRSLVGDREGSNLRNRISHGLMDFDEFHPYECEYFWWFVLRLCLLNFAFAPQSTTVNMSATGEPVGP